MKWIRTLYIKHVLIYHALKKDSFHECEVYFFNCFLFVHNFRGIRIAQFKQRWKDTYIKIHFRITYNSSNIFYWNSHIIYQIARCHTPESNEVKSKKRNYNSNEFTITFMVHKGSILRKLRKITQKIIQNCGKCGIVFYFLSEFQVLLLLGRYVGINWEEKSQQLT